MAAFAKSSLPACFEKFLKFVIILTNFWFDTEQCEQFDIYGQDYRSLTPISNSILLCLLQEDILN